jgi:hypothetical protein
MNVRAVTHEVIDFGDQGPTVPRSRLCDFKTAHSELKPEHKAWLRSNIVPSISRGGPLYLRLWGYASKLGKAEFNQQLSLQRANAVKRFLEQEARTSLSFVEVGGYGATRSAGAENDNGPVYRAVDVYVYRATSPPPPPQTPPPLPEHPSNIYLGLGVKFGGFAAVVGRQTMEARLYSSDQYENQFTLETAIWTAGAGLGGGMSLQLVLGFGAKQKSDFVGLKCKGWDFAADLGEHWGSLVKGAKNLRPVLRVARAMQSGHKSGAALRGLTKLSIGEWEQLSNLVKTIRDATDVDSNSKTPSICTFDIPLAGLGIELSLYRYWSTVEAVY